MSKTWFGVGMGDFLVDHKIMIHFRNPHFAVAASLKMTNIAIGGTVEEIWWIPVFIDRTKILLII
jgi:hypothetical protein